ncbi:leucine-rich_repeat domain-containing protein [Hexamita inflata]|uniref:Leucine-rich repeat domain-containing protein n=1 Tax=Hexamita inflata TaxID=28002 RepID=A0AA86Q185_9EUKA|nr:leucine-rich repeat domain-containing protein [Hexamita inflata]
MQNNNEANLIQEMSEYDQHLIQQFQNQVHDGILEIKDNQELTNLDFIKYLQVSKLALYGCKNIIKAITYDTIKELYIFNSGFHIVLNIQLNNLEILQLRGNQMEDTNKILIKMQNSKYFSQLKELDLSENYTWLAKIHQKIKDIRQNWEYISNIYSNMENLLIGKLNDQKSMINLVKLTLVGNNISDIDVLETVVNLQELDLSKNYKININPIQYLTKLTKLSLASCNLTDIQILSSLTTLISLNLSDNNRIDISPLKNLTKLMYLQLGASGIDDISILRSLINLKYLDISNNTFNDISPLQYLLNLTYLNITCSEIQDFSILRKLINLEQLIMTSNCNVDITSLQYLVKLRKLDLCKCGLYYISALRPLVNLQELILVDNYINDISPLIQLKNLIKLYLNDNRITNILNLQKHPNFQYFYINDQIQPIVSEQRIYSKMQNIDTSTILLQNTNLKRKHINTCVQYMKGRIPQLMQNLNINHLKFSRSIVQLWDQLDTIEFCQ